MTANNIQPLHDMVLCEVPKQEETSAGGIVLTSSLQTRPQQATVIAVGLGRHYGESFLQPTCKVGDTVLMSQHATSLVIGRDGTELREGDRFLVPFASLLAVAK